MKPALFLVAYVAAVAATVASGASLRAQRAEPAATPKAAVKVEPKVEPKAAVEVEPEATPKAVVQAAVNATVKAEPEAEDENMAAEEAEDDKIVAEAAPPAPKEAEDEKTAAAEKILQSLTASHEATHPAQQQQQPQHREKVDVGFGEFEKNLTATIVTSLHEVTGKNPAWKQDMQDRFTSNVTAALSLGLKEALAPLKQSIGKTWMALPQDDQKNNFVDTLHLSFTSVLAGQVKTILSHLKLSLSRVENFAKKSPALSADELVARSEATITEGLLAEHCYDDVPRHQKSGNASAAVPASKKFCIQSVINGMVHRLNDTEGLISMSMRFEAGAMSLAQKVQVAAAGAAAA